MMDHPNDDYEDRNRKTNSEKKKKANMKSWKKKMKLGKRRKIRIHIYFVKLKIDKNILIY